MRNPGEEIGEQFQRGLHLLRRRLDILTRYYPEPKERILDDATSLIDALESSSQSSSLSAEKKLFLLDLSAAATQIWEAWAQDAETHAAVFPEWSSPERQSDVIGILQHFMHILKSAFATGGVNRVREFGREEIVDVAEPAFKDVSDHQDVLFEIRSAEDPDEIRRFLSETKMYVFSGITAGQVLSLPSIGGDRIYISEQAFASTNTKQVVVHELAHNWAVWGQKPNKLLISNRRRLQSKEQQLISEGDFIETRLFGKNICFINPFCLNLVPDTNPVAILKTGPLSEM